MATRDDSKIFRGWIWDDGFFTDGFVFLSEHRLTGDPGYGEAMARIFEVKFLWIAGHPVPMSSNMAGESPNSMEVYPLVMTNSLLLKMAIYSEFSH